MDSNYYQKNKEKCLQYSKEWSKKNPEKRNEYAKKYYHKNKEQILSKKREQNALKPKKERRKDTYIFTYVDGKPYLQHRYNWELENGPIPKGYIIHHINGDIQDNRLENLSCISRKEHYLLHKETNITSTGTEYYTTMTQNWMKTNRQKWNEYQNNYKKENKANSTPQVKEYRKNYYNENKDAIIQKASNYYYKNKETILQKRKEAYQQNKNNQ